MRPKPMKLDDWRKRIKKLKKKYDSPTELELDCSKKIGGGYYYLTIDSAKSRVYIVPAEAIAEGENLDRIHVGKDQLNYEINEDGSIALLDTKKIIKDLIPVLAKHIDVNALVEDALTDHDYDDLSEMHERVIKKEAKISEAPPRCFYLSIGGKPGAPFRFYLRN